MMSEVRPQFLMPRMLANRIWLSSSARTFSLVAGLAAIAKLIGLAKEVAIASDFGAGPRIDAYLLVFNLLSLPATIWLAATSAILIPNLIHLERNESEEAASFLSEFFGLSVVAGLVLGPIAGAALYAYVSSPLSGLPSESQDLAITAVSWLWVMLPLLFLSYCGGACLMARNIHSNTLYDASPALCIAVALILTDDNFTALLAATAGGFFLQSVLTAISLYRRGDLYLPRIKLRMAVWRPLIPALLAIIGVQLLQSTTSVLDQLIVAWLGPNSISRFGYALRIQAVLFSLFALAVPRVLLPAIAVLRSQNAEDVDGFIRKWAWALGSFGLGLSIICTAFSVPMVSLLFERGSFGREDTITVAKIFAILSWQLPFYLLAMLYSQQKIVERNYRLLAWVAVSAIVSKVTIGFLLIHLLGLYGLAASVVVVSIIQVLHLRIISQAQRSKVGS
ncbi:lipid II flippase MurJ [Qipengyuania atrilutea]|uniref:Virulence factor MviN n=1 Tax=Qipengyuania atrilutea TaxID=2744473 RepID=A0A850H1D1_9SPHN|nr:lipid II flippase MurJ [Actirhodobacter atriluteus]NVD44407.1 hypothetical protein [Actirhodobacter atriluteus]